MAVTKINIGEDNRATHNPAHRLTVRTYEGVVVRFIRHDDNAPRIYSAEQPSDEYADVLVVIDNSLRSPSAVDVTIVYDLRGFNDADLDKACARLASQFETKVERGDYYDRRDNRRNPYKRVITFTMWKSCGQHDLPFDWLLHVLDVTLPLTWQIRKARAGLAARSDRAEWREDQAAK